ncbi:hypothetical protein [Candidatus Spongiihabitans sp.]|uniref:hypothetical protein n=1 Tax=Candidatus Spongiihabitans sp. TaxID=3101308 RepID=UPI003C7AEB95
MSAVIAAGFFYWIPCQARNDGPGRKGVIGVFCGFRKESGVAGCVFYWIPTCAGMTV